MDTENRGTTITYIVTKLKADVPDLKLVKPYEGELDRYSKKTQLKESIFPAQVNLTTPFAWLFQKAEYPR